MNSIRPIPKVPGLVLDCRSWGFICSFIVFVVQEFALGTIHWSVLVNMKFRIISLLHDLHIPSIAPHDNLKGGIHLVHLSVERTLGVIIYSIGIKQC